MISKAEVILKYWTDFKYFFRSIVKNDLKMHSCLFIYVYFFLIKLKKKLPN